MLVVPEALIAELVSQEDAYEAVAATFAAMARGEAYNFPVVREALGEPIPPERLYEYVRWRGILRFDYETRIVEGVSKVPKTVDNNPQQT